MLTILAPSTISSFSFNAPLWLGVLFATFSGLTMTLYLCAYLYFMFTDKDALRSETYSIQKLAIERGLRGDDLHGVIQVDTDQDLKALESAASGTSEPEQ